ncbi:MAG: AAA family ATPase [Acutalibacteraceae bacterium]
MSNQEKSNDNIEKEGGLFSSIYLSDIWKGIRKFWWVCIILIAAFGGYRFYNSYVKFVPSYSCSATFTISTQKSTLTDGGISVYSFYYDANTAAQLSDTFPYILGSNLLHDAIKEDLKIEYIPVSLSASSVTNSNMFTMTAKGSDPQLTYDILMSAIKNYPDVARYVVGNIKFTMITEPKVPATPVNKLAYKDDTFMGAAVGFLLWAVLIVIYAVQRKTIRTRDDIKNTLNRTVIGTLPQVTFKKYKKAIDKSILLTNDRVGSGFLESLRVFRNTFVHALGKENKVVMVTSTAPGEGKTTVVVNLAISLADLGKKVLLVEADLRNPSVCDCLGIDEKELEYSVMKSNFKISFIDKYNVSLLNLIDDKDKPWKYIKRDDLKAVFDSVRDNYDYVLVDTPPCGLVSDTILIAQATDAALYVILQDTVRISRIRNGLDGLLSTDVNVLGCVLNGAMSGASGYGENYGYGYGYGYGYKRYGRYGYGYGKYGYGYGYGEDKKEKRQKRRSKDN